MLKDEKVEINLILLQEIHQKRNGVYITHNDFCLNSHGLAKVSKLEIDLDLSLSTTVFLLIIYFI